MVADRQTHGVPALMSFFLPGLGQLVKGQILRALLVWGLFLGDLLFFALLAKGTDSPGLFFLSLPVLVGLWLWNVYDAYNR
jgi:hypothetical protein